MRLHDYNSFKHLESKKPIYDTFCCPYCQSKSFVRRGFRQKKYEKIQLYLCQSCGRTFTPQKNLGKHYPLETVFNALSLYNLGHSLEGTCTIINSKPETLNPKQTQNMNAQNTKQKDLEHSNLENLDLSRISNLDIRFSLQPSTVSAWLMEFGEYCKYQRMREFVVKKYEPKNTVVTATLAHRQLYRYRFHRAKCALMIQEEYAHRKFAPLKEFLELVPSECPHQYFASEGGCRASEAPITFSKKQMIVRSKVNYAVKLCQFILQSVKARTMRHEAVQKFFLFNDSVTVATEVPVYITREDLLHMQTQLGFEIFNKISVREGQGSEDRGNVGTGTVSQSQSPNRDDLQKQGATPAMGQGSEDISNVGTGLPKLITGHIDLVQIRNGQIHILDYKPNAAKEQPIDQLTIYAMALSRLTGLRLFEFKCAWFDEKDYFEFYPLHVLYKPSKTRRRKTVTTIEGKYHINEEEKKVVSVKPR
ncbi:MAG: PD-(D/E)XK nuclease family protein [Patescibacteria group bacterium]